MEGCVSNGGGIVSVTLCVVESYLTIAKFVRVQATWT